MRRVAARIGFLSALALMGGNLPAQTYQLRTVAGGEGLTSPFTHALAQDAQGHLWIGTGEGVGRFDGRKVTMFTTADSLAENYVASIHPDGHGTVWLGHNEGGITRWRGGRFRPLATSGLTSSTINAIEGDGHGGIWAIAQNEGVVHADSTGGLRVAAGAPAILWYALLNLGNGQLLAGASNGLHLFKIVAGHTLVAIPGLENITQAPVRALEQLPDGRIFAGTEDEGVLSFAWDGTGPSGVRTTIGAADGLSTLRVRCMDVGANGQLLVGTAGQGAYEMGMEGSGPGPLRHFGKNNGLGTDVLEDVLLDREGNIWFARPGLGLARLLDRAVVYYFSGQEDGIKVESILAQGREAWFGTRGGVLHAHGGAAMATDTFRLGPDLGQDEVTALLRAPDGRIWAGTGSHGLFRLEPSGAFTKVPFASDRLSGQVHSLAYSGNALWVGTSNGIYVIDSAQTRHITTMNGLMHNRVNAVFPDRSGRVWVACNNGGVSVIQNDTAWSFNLVRDGVASHVTGIAEDDSGTMWFSTYGSGVWYADSGTYHALTAAQGLRSDYCYAIIADGNGAVWVAHRGGVGRIGTKSHAIKAFDRQFGILPDLAINAMAVDTLHRLWFATDAGVVRYDNKLTNAPPLPPAVVITTAKVFGREVPTDQDLELPPDIYRLRFDFMGISMKDPDAVQYRYKLNGHDLEWTTTKQTSALYMRVQEGTYAFTVQAAYPDGAYSQPAVLHITVRTPLVKQDWFIAVCAALVLLAIGMAFRIRDRNQRHAKEQLQLALDERTHELKTKKEELELSNKDITDSITYARRIQQASLPLSETLTELFPKSFIIYRPRDIVSGDFYWFRQFGEKFILACADCTGHGVPGAFMSMIGSLLLREVSTDREVQAPDVLLRNLDRELRTVLQYHGDDSASRDGMDISLCELDLQTRRLRFAAAMQDVLLVRDGQLSRLRGSRRSIGGLTTNTTDKPFDLVDLPLSPGDRIYLFSDGVPDQFGGAQGKKLKVSGLMSLIANMQASPMEQQAELLQERLLAWQGAQGQVDDILFIGIEV